MNIPTTDLYIIASTGAGRTLKIEESTLLPRREAQARADYLRGLHGGDWWPVLMPTAYIAATSHKTPARDALAGAKF